MADADKQSRGTGGLRESSVRARKWLVGLVLAGVAAALTGYVSGGITSGADRVRDMFEEEPAPVSLTLDRSIRVQRRPKLGSAHYVFTRPISSLSYPSSGDLRQIPAWDTWAHQHGGQEADQTGVQVVIEGTSSLPVVLTGLTIDVVRRAPPPRGVFVVPFGGGPLGVRYFEANLDNEPPEVTSVRAEFGNEPAIDFPYRVSQTEPEVLNVVAYSRTCDCLWRAVLHWISHGKRGATVIDNEGRPFRTVSSARSTPYNAVNGRFVKGSS